jgi:hypothetical protein
MEILKSVQHILFVSVAGFLLNISIDFLYPSTSNIAFHAFVPCLVGFYAAAWSWNRYRHWLAPLLDGFLALCISGILWLGFVLIFGIGDFRSLGFTILGFVLTYMIPGISYLILGTLIAPQMKSLLYGSLGSFISFLILGVLPSGPMSPTIALLLMGIIPLVSGFVAGRAALVHSRRGRALWEAQKATALAGFGTVAQLVFGAAAITCGGFAATTCDYDNGSMQVLYAIYNIVFLLYGLICGLPAILIPRRKSIESPLVSTPSIT